MSESTEERQDTPTVQESLMHTTRNRATKTRKRAPKAVKKKRSRSATKAGQRPEGRRGGGGDQAEHSHTGKGS